ncbi:MAG: PilN domain-containing protein [Betaproteobacteria bacterium]|nr:PilN domain-containing protein [Betaproteobacteria bacterium]
MPESVYLTSLRQRGQEIVVSGVTQSQARVSEFMRNISASPWLGSPRLNEVKGELRGQRRFATFSLRFSMESNPEAAVAEENASLEEIVAESHNTDNVEEAGQ